MYDRTPALEQSFREAEGLGELRLAEVTPSRRDFAQCVSTDEDSIEVVAALTSTQDVGLSRETLVARACRCDDAEVAALALSFGVPPLSVGDAAAVAVATTAPILRNDLCVDPAQLYHARLHGADAVILPAGGVPGPLIEELAAVAHSLHMATVVEVSAADEIDVALRIARSLLGVRCTPAEMDPDPNVLLPFLRRVPENRTVVVLDRIGSAEVLAELRGVCDAALVPASLCETEAGRTALQRLAGR